MKALIFNSGIGKRLGELTKNSPKSFLKLKNGENLFERQIRLLSECGIKEFIVTTGPFEEMFKEVSKKEKFKHLKFIFVHNNIYDKSNYIYSFYLAREYLRDDDFLTLHGDLVFNKKLVKMLIENPNNSCGLINKKLALPEKDFKARVHEGKIVEVGINIFDEDCFTFQPLYKLCKEDMNKWIESIIDYIENKKEFNVYAENAFNDISQTMNIVPVSYEQYYINEIDNVEDYEKVSADIKQVDYQDQEILYGSKILPIILKRENIERPLVVVDKFLENSELVQTLKEEFSPVCFSEFKPNPEIESIKNAISIFKKNDCDCIIALGGGSAIDVSKGVKYYLNQVGDEEQFEVSQVKLIAIPTTAGTGSESTTFAAIYVNGNKTSLASDWLLPDVAIIDKDFLKSLPLNQKKATVFDALCQAIEAFWSVNSNETSKEYSINAIRIILDNIDNYLMNNDENVYLDIFKAANMAGRAINIAKTTAAHAMSYKLTTLYGIPHGCAAILCLPGVFEKLKKNYERTTDKRGKEYVERVLNELDVLFNGDALFEIKHLIKKYEINFNFQISDVKMKELVRSINVQRLSNFPLELTKEDILEIYSNLTK